MREEEREIGVQPQRAAPFDKMWPPSPASEAARREHIQKTYIRVCGDCGFKMDMAQAAHFAGKLIGVSPLEIWIALGIDDMERIASGTHPALLNPRYANEWTRLRATALKQAADDAALPERSEAP